MRRYFGGRRSWSAVAAQAHRLIVLRAEAAGAFQQTEPWVEQGVDGGVPGAGAFVEFAGLAWQAGVPAAAVRDRGLLDRFGEVGPTDAIGR